ncbi:tyrosine-type recombinase/integrase [Paucibacter sp. O1-1]|nr:tyrosine-type recombinase/integrase [Paucibacter sp. O1-1]MDA3827856.1 tyrosine-type recombinase/integrase [Paucibacter sp. O1-1]
MTAAALAGVLEAIALALRALPSGDQAAFVMPAMQPAPAPAPPQPPQAPLEQPAQAHGAAACGGTVADWLKTYRTIIADRGYDQQTIKNRTTSLRYIETHLGARPLRAIKPHEIASLLKTCSPHKAGRVLGELRDIYTEAINNGEAETSPAAHVKPPRAPGLRKRLTLETWQSMLELSKAGPQRWVYAMLLLALATGQRRADLAKMKFSDVVDGHLRVEQQKKARKLVGARVAIPLTLRLAATGMTLGDVIELCRGIGAPGEYLLRKQGGGPIEMSSLSARFREHLLAVLPADAHKQYEWPSLHEVRSLSARTYIAEGMAPATVQTLLGHKHAEMTAIYLNDRGLTDAEWKTVECA